MPVGPHKAPIVSSAVCSIYCTSDWGFSVARVGLVDEQQHFNVNLSINRFGASCCQWSQCVHVHQLTSWPVVNVNTQLLALSLLQLVLALQPGSSQLRHSCQQA